MCYVFELVVEGWCVVVVLLGDLGVFVMVVVVFEVFDEVCDL